MDNKFYLLALNRAKQIGPRTIFSLLKHWPRLYDMFQLSSDQLLAQGIPVNIARSINQINFEQVEADYAWAKQPSHHLVTWADPEYPSLLRQIYDPPPVLYACGDLNALSQTAIAMVGTRKPSMSGKEMAWQFAYDLARYNITIVSGLALGIDAAVHKACLAAAGRTIAVMGTGIDCIYPRQHRTLAEKIIQNGLLLSEFPLKTPAIAGHFPRRNRIISGLTSATLVVEAAIKSGSLITARLALEQNREVMAIPGSIQNPQARGCHYLLQQGAKLVTTVSDIVEELQQGHRKDESSERRLVGLENKTQQIGQTIEVKNSKPKLTLASKNENLVKCIEFEITTVDQILVRSGLDIEHVMCGLAELELNGEIASIPGGYIRLNWKQNSA